MRASSTSGPFRFTGRHMFFAIAGFFLVIVSVNVTMAILATSSWTGLVVENSYVASQHYNEELARSRKQTSNGWQSSLVVESRRIKFSLNDANGVRIYPTAAKLRLGRPAFEQQDRIVLMKAGSDGLLTADFNVASGIWILEVHADTPKGEYRRRARVMVSENGEGRLE